MFLLYNPKLKEESHLKVKRSSILALLAVSVLWCGAWSCNQYHQAVVIQHDFQLTVSAAQEIEINEYKAGNIPSDTHKAIQQVFLKIGQAGEQVATQMQANASKQTILATLSGITDSLNTLLNQGTLGIKNPTTLANFQVAIKAVQATIANLQTFLRGAS